MTSPLLLVSNLRIRGAMPLLPLTSTLPALVLRNTCVPHNRTHNSISSTKHFFLEVQADRHCVSYSCSLMLLGWQINSVPSDSGFPVFQSLTGYQAFICLITSWVSSVPTKHASTISTESATMRSPVSRILFSLYDYYRYRNPIIYNQHSYATTSLLRHNTMEIK
jgi:hypothetical protein